MSWMVGYLVGWLVGYLVGWLTCLVDYSEEGSAEKNKKIEGITHAAYRTAYCMTHVRNPSFRRRVKNIRNKTIFQFLGL